MRAAQLLPRSGATGPWIFPRTGQPEMGKDPLNYGPVVDRSDQLHPPSAARTAQDVEVERAAHQQSPANADVKSRYLGV